MILFFIVLGIVLYAIMVACGLVRTETEDDSYKDIRG